MTTKNLSKSFKGKVNGQRLPPIPMTNDQLSTVTTTTAATATVTNGDHPISILKKSTPLTDNVTTNDHKLPLDDGIIRCNNHVIKYHRFYFSR